MSGESVTSGFCFLVCVCPSVCGVLCVGVCVCACVYVKVCVMSVNVRMYQKISRNFLSARIEKKIVLQGLCVRFIVSDLHLAKNCRPETVSDFPSFPK